MKLIDSAVLALLWLMPWQATSDGMVFNRISFFPVCLQLDPSCRVDNETSAEIVAASKDGMTLIYSDSPLGVVGTIDITDPYHPTPLGIIDVGGEPTSVTVVKGYAVVGVNTSPDFENPSGILHVLDYVTGEVLRTMDLGGQPDSLNTSPDDRFVAIAIENERDEDLGEGGLPQLPAGFLQVLSTESDDVEEWELTRIDLEGLEGLVEPSDPEPEFVSINEDNICVVTLQENNAIVLVDLESSEVIASFSAGTVDLYNIDLIEDEVINQDPSANLTNRPREPDGVVWIDNDYFVTADEGDWNGGTRGFTVYDKEGSIVYTSAEEMETVVTMLGHYPESRSENKGNEPENVEFGIFGDTSYLFVNSERSSLTFVYDVNVPADPVFLQALPASVSPEGSKAIPDRNLLVVATETDDRGGKVRGGVSIYMYMRSEALYPTIVSDIDDSTGNPIPFGALSGLAAAEPYDGGAGDWGRRLARRKGKQGPQNRRLAGEIPVPPPLAQDELGEESLDEHILYSIEDSYYKKNRIFVINATGHPAVITAAMRIMDSDGVFADALGEGDMKDALINDDNTVNIDPEGIAVSHKGGFWLAHEGRGTVGDGARPVESPNVLFKLSEEAVIEKVVLLPDELNEIQLRFGFEGVAEDGDYVVVAFQRAWGDEKYPRIGVYNSVSEEWKFAFYPLGQPESQNGGWVGLSDIAPLGDGHFMVLERDNQAGLDAAIKRIFVISLGDYESWDDGTTIEKHFYMDLIPEMAYFGGATLEKVEGLAVTKDGFVYVNTDNDGVEDSGEQLFGNVGWWYPYY
ncbi:alkaline phosphatase [Seminavis robusta]|uniref:Alkaline phosphatase n=1 Tax=Seminavis robusta TaxID=568900 RepID=A0A9N8D8Z1_9STRA|nr:alkaline phosphatase [Seminavis robusta]|eukprot:Sro4_g003560.1 alkaline phosphatase (801) ;mRNA; f:189599-192169